MAACGSSCASDFKRAKSCEIYRFTIVMHLLHLSPEVKREEDLLMQADQPSQVQEKGTAGTARARWRIVTRRGGIDTNAPYSTASTPSRESLCVPSRRRRNRACGGCMRVRDQCRVGGCVAVNAVEGGSPWFQLRNLAERPLRMPLAMRLTGGRRYRCSGTASRVAANSSFWFRRRHATGPA